MQPECSRISQTTYAFKGCMDDYLRGITRQWLMVAPLANPAMLEMFRDRDRRPRRDLLPWSGEFAGKYLTSAVQILRLTGDAELRAFIGGFVDQLVELQAEDGYLGPWPKSSRLTGAAPNVGGKQGNTWDAWGHYHLMLGLLLWYEDSGAAKAVECAARMGDLFCRKFLGRRRRRLVDTGSTEMNLAPVHALCLLYRTSGDRRHLEMALQIVDEFAAQGPDGPLAGDYLRQGLAGREFFQGPKPRWESLHPILGLAELYWITGEEEYRQAFEHLWWSIVAFDRHNNGGFSSGEQAQGNPYHLGAIETCCTIAWMAMSVEMLRLTGNPVVADELELSTLNSALGLLSPSGRWATYNTPMDGVRKASAHDIVFQAREGSPELNCCSVNGPRGLGLVSDWAAMRHADGLALNWYGASTIEVRLAPDLAVQLEQQTEYPRQGRIEVQVMPDKAATFALKLRIPYWSAGTRVAVNGEAVAGVNAGSYLTLNRPWQRGDRVTLDLDMGLHYWAGEQACRNRASIYRGPLLLTYDRRLNEWDPQALPVLEAKGLSGCLLDGDRWLPTIALLEFQGKDGRALRLCDFASAGQGGSPYISWLKVKGVPKAGFSKENPLRSGSV